MAITKTCIHCNEIFNVPNKAKNQIYCSRTCVSVHLKKPTKIINCLNCNTDISILDIPNRKHSHRKFCCKSCSATFNNTNRKHTEETKLKISNKLKKDKPIKVKKSRPKTTKIEKIKVKKEKSIKFNDKKYNLKEFPNTAVRKNTCKKCNCIFYKRNYQKYCDNHLNLFSRDTKALFKFTFNVYNYTDLFDLSLIDNYGWYSPGSGKCKKPKNVIGISRDHKVSVNEAILNNYDPYYIRHPINCELMSHRENNKKNTNSSITYEELKILVDEYENRKN